MNERTNTHSPDKPCNVGQTVFMGSSKELRETVRDTANKGANVLDEIIRRTAQDWLK